MIIVLSGVAQALVLSATPGNHRLGRTVDDPLVQMTSVSRRRCMTECVGLSVIWRREKVRLHAT